MGWEMVIKSKFLWSLACEHFYVILGFPVNHLNTKATMQASKMIESWEFQTAIATMVKYVK